jgi:hypothetical protein
MRPVPFFKFKFFLVTTGPMLTALAALNVPYWVKGAAVVLSAGVTNALAYLLKTTEPDTPAITNGSKEPDK